MGRFPRRCVGRRSCCGRWRLGGLPHIVPTARGQSASMAISMMTAFEHMA